MGSKWLKGAKMLIWTQIIFLDITSRLNPNTIRTQFLSKILVRYLGLYQNIELWPQWSFEVTGGQILSFYFFAEMYISEIEKFTYIWIFWYKYPFDTPDLAKYRFRSIFHILACLSQATFKESIEGQTRGSKKANL